jgi:PKD repeat protein
MKYLFLILTILFLVTSCIEKEPPVACFNFESIDSVDGGIQFSNCSVEASSYNWTFNNSTGSQEKNPFFISDLNFPINVELIATNEFGIIERRHSCSMSK